MVESWNCFGFSLALPLSPRPPQIYYARHLRLFDPLTTRNCSRFPFSFHSCSANEPFRQFSLFPEIFALGQENNWNLHGNFFGLLRFHYTSLYFFVSSCIIFILWIFHPCELCAINVLVFCFLLFNLYFTICPAGHLVNVVVQLENREQVSERVKVFKQTNVYQRSKFTLSGIYYEIPRVLLAYVFFYARFTKCLSQGGKLTLKVCRIGSSIYLEQSSKTFGRRVWTKDRVTSQFFVVAFWYAFNSHRVGSLGGLALPRLP